MVLKLEILEDLGRPSFGNPRRAQHNLGFRSLRSPRLPVLIGLMSPFMVSSARLNRIELSLDTARCGAIDECSNAPVFVQRLLVHDLPAIPSDFS